MAADEMVFSSHKAGQAHAVGKCRCPQCAERQANTPGDFRFFIQWRSASLRIGLIIARDFNAQPCPGEGPVAVGRRR